MARLKYAPNLKLQDQTGNSEIVICVGVQAWEIARLYEGIGNNDSENIIAGAFNEDGRRFPCVVVEALDEIENLRIAPKKARYIRLIRANNAQNLSQEDLEKVYLNLATNTQAESVLYCDESNSLIEDASNYIRRLRTGDTYHGKLVDDEYPERFKRFPDNRKARDFLEWLNAPLLSDSKSQIVYTYTGKKWQALNKRDLGRLVRDFFNAYNLGYSARRIDSLVGLLSDYELPPLGEANHDLLGFSNGVLNKRTGEFVPHDESQFLTSFIDVDYTAEKRETPNFNKWINWAGDDDPNKIRVILAALYMGLTNRHNWQMFIDAVGVGGSGKSIFIEIAKLLAGEDNTAAITLKELESPVIRAKLLDKTLFYSSDQGYYKGDGAELKAITGGDTIGLNPKYVDPFDGVILAVFMMSSNERIIFTDNQGGVARRRVIIRFNRQVPTEARDVDLKDKLKKELAGIIRLVLDEFPNPEDARLLLDGYRDSEEAREVKKGLNHIYDFVGHFTTTETANGLGIGIARSTMPTVDEEKRFLYPAYLHYCSANNLDKPLPRPRFIESFKAALRELKAPYPWKERQLGGRKVTNVEYKDIAASITEWNGQ